MEDRLGFFIVTVHSTAKNSRSVNSNFLFAAQGCGIGMDLTYCGKYIRMKAVMEHLLDSAR